MPTGNVIAGRGTVRVDGVIYNCSEIKPQPASDKAESVVGQGGVAGFKVSPVAPRLEVTVLMTADVKMDTIKKWRDVTVGVEMANGRQYTFEGAHILDPATHDNGNGTSDVAFEAMSCEEG